MYTFEQLKDDVRKEAEALRVHATKEERERITEIEFNPMFASTCIYGLIDGSCTSPRAHELISKCCKVMVDNDQYCPLTVGAKSIVLSASTAIDTLNTARVSTNERTRLKYLSPIEAYILLPEANNANLISFLRGETETLEL